MKKLITLLLVVTSFVLLLIKVGSTIVNSITGLLPESAHDWLPIIKILLWFLTFSFDIMVTYFLYIIILFITIFILKTQPFSLKKRRREPYSESNEK